MSSLLLCSMPRWVLIEAYRAVPVRFLFSLQSDFCICGTFKFFAFYWPDNCACISIYHLTMKTANSIPVWYVLVCPATYHPSLGLITNWRWSFISRTRWFLFYKLPSNGVWFDYKHSHKSFSYFNFTIISNLLHYQTDVLRSWPLTISLSIKTKLYWALSGLRYCQIWPAQPVSGVCNFKF